MKRALLALCLLSAACSAEPAPPAEDANAAIDSLNARLSRAYRTHDPDAYAEIFTDSAVFEWPAFDSPRGKEGMRGMARANWAALRDMDLRLTVSTRRIAPDHATEIGAFEQSYADTTGARMTEYGRYAAILAREEDGSWRMDRFLGFADSTKTMSNSQF